MTFDRKASNKGDIKTQSEIGQNHLFGVSGLILTPSSGQIYDHTPPYFL